MNEPGTTPQKSRGWQMLVLKIIAGYLVAVPVATVATILCMLIGTVVSDGATGWTVAGIMDDLLELLMVGLVYTAGTAWPSYLITMLLALRSAIRFGPIQFALAGFLTSIQAIILLELFVGAGFGDMLFELEIVVPIFFGGAGAGYAYGLWHPKLHKR